jgi:hypothetical protein
MLLVPEQRRFQMSEASGWYADPTGRHTYRYWGGTRWSNQVSDGGTAGLDPIEMDEATAGTPPAPGTHAPGMQPTTTPGPSSSGVEVTQRSGGSGAGILGVLVGAIIVIIILVIVFNNVGDDGDTTPTEAPAVTEPIEEPAPTDAPATTSAS